MSILVSYCVFAYTSYNRPLTVFTANYTKLCTIEIDLSHLPLTPRAKPNSTGLYYRLDYDIVLLFGLTELKAQVAWKEGVSVSLFVVMTTQV